MRQTKVDLPRPGRPSTSTLGLAMRPPRLNQLIGSEHTVARLKRWRPSGTPTSGTPEPTIQGHSPQTCTVVARNSGGASRSEVLPPPAPGHPLAPGPRSGRRSAGRLGGRGALDWAGACRERLTWPPAGPGGRAGGRS
jgi:hypothetical protein